MMKTREAVYKYRICWRSMSTGEMVSSAPMWDSWNDAMSVIRMRPDNQYYSYWVEKVEVKEREAENVNS